VEALVAHVPFENLKVYRLAEELADAVWDAVVRWDEFAKRAIGSQIVRAADSIGANIAEGAGRGSFQDNRRFVRIARGSLNETKHFLHRAYRRKLMAQATVDRLAPMLKELGPRLNAYLRAIGPVQSRETPE
jgi:four helix bundle protein